MGFISGFKGLMKLSALKGRKCYTNTLHSDISCKS